MKFPKSILLLGLLSLSLGACNSGSVDPTSANPSTGDTSIQPTSTTTVNPPAGDEYSQILKDCATQIFQLSSSKQTLMKPGFQPQEAPGQALAFPAVYLYWSGLLNDIEGVSIVGKAINSKGTYKFNGMGGYIQSIDFDLSVDFDKVNNKFTFLGRQDLPGTDRHSFIVLTCDYNFTSKALGGFSVLMQEDTTTSFNYMRYINNVFEMYSYGPQDNYQEDPEYIEYHAIADAGIAVLNSRMATEMILEGDKLQASREAFKAASDYCDEITDGTDFDVEIVNE